MSEKRQLLTDASVAISLFIALFAVFLTEQFFLAPSDANEDPESRGTLLRPVRRVRAGSVYEARTAENRQEMLKRRGGSPLTEQAVQDGLDWLARHQAEDGSWSDQCLGKHPKARCERGKPCGGPGRHYPTAQTGLSLLALQGGGHFYFNESPYSTQVKRGLDWLIGQQARDGCLTTDRSQYFMYQHAIGTFALAEAVATARHSDEPPDPRYVRALELAVDFVRTCQDPRGGGWRYAPGQPGDTSVSGWVALALKTAREAEVSVDPGCIASALTFFAACETPDRSGRTGYTSPYDAGSDSLTGVGMIVHHFLKGQSDTPLVKSAASYLAGRAEQGLGPDDYYLWYNCTLGMFLAGGPEWERWNKVVRQKVVSGQIRTGCERGSWPPDRTHYSAAGGRIYSTALAVLTLEVYYRFARKDGPGN